MLDTKLILLTLEMHHLQHSDIFNPLYNAIIKIFINHNDNSLCIGMQ